MTVRRTLQVLDFHRTGMGSSTSHLGSENIMAQKRVFGARVLLLSAGTFLRIKAAMDHIPRVPLSLTQEWRVNLLDSEDAMLVGYLSRT